MAEALITKKTQEIEEDLHKLASQIDELGHDTRTSLAIVVGAKPPTSPASE